MTPRSIRRAAERKANKLARHAANTVAVPSADPVPAAEEGATDACKAALNSVTSPFTGGSFLLPASDAGPYEKHLRAYEHQYQPAGAEQCALVQSLAVLAWRLNRIPRLEMAIFALGHAQFGAQFDEYEETQRPALIEAHTFLVYEKQLRTLQQQEARMLRRREKEIAELHRVQEEQTARLRATRDGSEPPELTEKPGLASVSEPAFNPPSFDQAGFDQIGFEFSNSPHTGHLTRLPPGNLACNVVTAPPVPA